MPSSYDVHLGPNVGGALPGLPERKTHVMLDNPQKVNVYSTASTAFLNEMPGTERYMPYQHSTLTGVMRLNCEGEHYLIMGKAGTSTEVASVWEWKDGLFTKKIGATAALTGHNFFSVTNMIPLEDGYFLMAYSNYVERYRYAVATNTLQYVDRLIFFSGVGEQFLMDNGSTFYSVYTKSTNLNNNIQFVVYDDYSFDIVMFGYIDNSDGIAAIVALRYDSMGVYLGAKKAADVTEGPYSTVFDLELFAHRTGDQIYIAYINRTSAAASRVGCWHTDTDYSFQRQIVYRTSTGAPTQAEFFVNSDFIFFAVGIAANTHLDVNSSFFIKLEKEGVQPVYQNGEGTPVDGFFGGSHTEAVNFYRYWVGLSQYVPYANIYLTTGASSVKSTRIELGAGVITGRDADLIPNVAINDNGRYLGWFNFETQSIGEGFFKTQFVELAYMNEISSVTASAGLKSFEGHYPLGNGKWLVKYIKNGITTSLDYFSIYEEA